MAAVNITPTKFAVGVLRGVGAPVTQGNVAGIVGWAKAEGGHYNGATYNFLNTTQPMPGAGNTGSQGNIKVYTSPQQGIAATVQTLRNGDYGGILQALRGSNPQALATAIGHSPWGTSGSLVAQTISQALGGKYNVNAGGLPATPAAPAPGGRNNQALAIARQFITSTQGSKDPFNLGTPKTGLPTTEASNPLLSSGLLSANYSKAQSTLEGLAGSALNQHPAAFAASLKGSGYTDPLPGATWERTDMGVDASMKNGAPIRALGDSKVVGIMPNWYQGQPYVKFQLLNGPQAGKFYYIAEAINPTVQPGQVVRAGQQIGTYNASGTGLELGWATSGWQTLAQATGNTGGPGHANAPAGQSFRNFLNGIGANAGG